jgi:hypothetical protein
MALKYPTPRPKSTSEEHDRLHDVDSSTDHAAANEENFGKYVRANPDTGAIEFSTVDSFVEEDVISNVVAGGIKPLDVIEEGTNLTTFVQRLLTTVYDPTITEANPTLSGGTNQEIGTIYDAPLTFNFSTNVQRGVIIGAMSGGIWNPSAFQNYRTGAATKYVIEGEDLGLNNVGSTKNRYIVLGQNRFTGRVEHTQGAQPLKSDGSNFSSPLPAGSITRNRDIQGQRKAFWDSRNYHFRTFEMFWSQSGNGLTIVPWELGDHTQVLTPGTKIILSDGMTHVSEYPCERIVSGSFYDTSGPSAGRTRINLTTPQPGSSRRLDIAIPSKVEQIRGLSQSMLNPVKWASGNPSFTINLTTGDIIVIFSYPSTLGDVSSVLHREASNAEIKDVFTKVSPNIQVGGVNNFSPVDYNTYYYIPSIPFVANEHLDIFI